MLFTNIQILHYNPSLEEIKILHLSCKFLTKHAILASFLQADVSLARILQDHANLARLSIGTPQDVAIMIMESESPPIVKNDGFRGLLPGFFQNKVRVSSI